MNSRAETLVRWLGLQRHPEGGFYREVYRRAAVTTIYFLLPAGERSRWHRVRSEEIWHYYEGAPLDLVQLTPNGGELERFVLGALSDLQQPVQCVPAGYWQAARSRGDYTLVGCTVAPAFRFEDFSMLKDFPELASKVSRAHPAVAEFV